MSGPTVANGTYPLLNTYAMLAYSGITTVGTSSVTNGVYGSSPTASYSGTFSPGSSDTPNAAAAKVQLDALIVAINGFVGTVGVPPASPATTQVTFTPGKYATSGLTFNTGSSIVFDGGGDVNSQFYIIDASAFTFTNVSSITLINGARNANIYWLANSAITFGNPQVLATIPGVFIAVSGISFASGAAAVRGRLYVTTGPIGLQANSTINGYLTQPSDICFPGETPINTDQGMIPISKLIAGVHTINNKRIVTVTETIAENTYLVCFKKDSLGENVPTQDTIVSKYHGVEHNNEMFEAHEFLDHFEDVVKVEYTGEIMYNILMDTHEKIIVNNLICETLNPDHPLARQYNTDFITNEKVSNIELLCA